MPSINWPPPPPVEGDVGDGVYPVAVDHEVDSLSPVGLLHSAYVYHGQLPSGMKKYKTEPMVKSKSIPKVKAPPLDINIEAKEANPFVPITSYEEYLEKLKLGHYMETHMPNPNGPDSPPYADAVYPWAVNENKITQWITKGYLFYDKKQRAYCANYARCKHSLWHGNEIEIIRPIVLFDWSLLSQIKEEQRVVSFFGGWKLLVVPFEVEIYVF